MGLIRGLAALCTIAMIAVLPVSLPAAMSAQASHRGIWRGEQLRCSPRQKSEIAEGCALRPSPAHNEPLRPSPAHNEPLRPSPARNESALILHVSPARNEPALILHVSPARNEPTLRRTWIAAAPVADACAGATTATNNVIHFYRAVDRRQFASAYQCLTPAERRRLPYGPFVAGYAHTVTSRLVLADSDVPNGDPVDHVTFDLHAVDRTAHGLVASVFMGHWVVDKAGRLERGVVTSFRHAAVTAIPPTNISDVFAYARRVVLTHVHADVTGDKHADDIYVTSGIGCASCHAQQIWVYSLGRLVFQQEVDDAEVRVARDHAGLEVRTDTPNTPGIDSCCPSERTFEQWAWTPFGFVLRSQRFVQQHG